MMLKHLSLTVFILAFSLAASAEPIELDRVHRDWRQVGMEAESGRLPVLLLVTSPDCGYCELLKRELLRPLQRVHNPGFILRELEQKTGGKIVDFDGEKVRAQIFLRRYEVYATPTLLFLDSKGNALHEPVTGYNGTEHYPQIFDEALRESRVVLEQIAGKHARRVAAKAPRR